MNNAVLCAQSGAFQRLQGGLGTSERRDKLPKAQATWHAHLFDFPEKYDLTSENTEAKRSQAQTLGLNADSWSVQDKPKRQIKRNTNRRTTCRRLYRAICRQLRRGSDHGGDAQ
jgi:hypothetical protein